MTSSEEKHVVNTRLFIRQVPFNSCDMSQMTCEKEVDVGDQVPNGTCRELCNLIMGLVR